MPIPAWMYGAQIGLDAIGGLAGGIAGADESEKARKDVMNVSRGQLAPSLARGIETAPMRDRAIFTLMQRMGVSPTAFRMSAHSGSEPMQRGGMDMEELARRNNSYTPGAGGVDTSIYRLLLEGLGLGYHPSTGYVRHDNPNYQAHKINLRPSEIKRRGY